MIGTGMDAKLAVTEPNQTMASLGVSDKRAASITPFQYCAAQLYVKSWLRPTIAKALMDKFWEPEERSPQLLAKIRKRLQQLESMMWFRDLIYQMTIEQLDLESPDIIRGVAGMAKKGRVDAAKFSLELAGRYQPKQDQNVTAVQIVMGDGVARPQLDKARPVDIIDHED